MKRKRLALVTGLPYYAKYLADLMNEHSQHWEMRAYDSRRRQTVLALLAMRKADALICFGGPGPDAGLAAAARKHNVPVVVVWSGTDVIRAQADPHELQIVKHEHFHHISDGEWLVGELALLGLYAEYEPLTAVRPGGPVKALPSEFRVLTHGASLVYEIARRMPHVRFTVVGPGDPSRITPANVEFIGYVDNMEDVIDDSTVVLRLPEHDGKEMLVFEALARARHVVWNDEFPHVRTARTAKQAQEQLENLRRLHEAGSLALNTAGRTYVLSSFGRKETAARLETRLNGLMPRTDASLGKAKQRVAISGLRIFCADIATYARTMAPNWEVRLLRTSSRLEILTSILALIDCDVWYSIGNPIGERFLTIAARLLRKPRVMHWVGSDILVLAEDPELREKLAARNILHLAEASWTAKEVQRFGLRPRIAPLPPRHHHGNALPLPRTFTVMLYVPKTRSEFYGRSAFERLMERMRDKPIRYIVVGGGDIAVPGGVDVTNLGWRDDLKDAYKEATVLVRFTPHDGLSLMVLEALSYGRHVVWTQPFPFVRHVAEYADIEREIRELFDAHERGELRPQKHASEDVKRHYSPEMCVQTLAQAWEDAANPQEGRQLAAQAR